MVNISSPVATVYDKAPGATIATERDDAQTMKAAAWYGKHSIKIDQVGLPKITDPADAILKVTSTAICGSDLHLYERAMPGLAVHDIMGHEFMGIVLEVGPAVKGFQKGDRVVASFNIGCGTCFFCKEEQLFTACDKTNPSAEQELLYGARSGGFHGYSHLTGGWAGGQAEYTRVPFADVNLLKLPQSGTDSTFILISDVLATSWHSTELGDVHDGDVVAIWGAGPVGILAAHCAFVRGAQRVILIDQEQYRLDFAKSKMPKLEVLNNKEEKSVAKVLHDTTQGRGPDVGIEAVGFHYGSTLHQVEKALLLETDPSDIINEIILSVRKGGRISIVGVYAGLTNHFNIGAFMEKGQTMRAGQTPVQRYWHKLLDLIQQGTLHPEMVITHNLPLEEAAHGYKIFNDKTDGCIKVVLKPFEVKA